MLRLLPAPGNCQRLAQALVSLPHRVSTAGVQEAATLLEASLMATMLAGAWWLCLLSGGSSSAAPHLFYLPIVLVSVRFGWAGAGISALVAGFLAGPALPKDVAADIPQPTTGWVLRLVIFLLVALLTAWATRERSRPMLGMFKDARAAAGLRAAIGKGQVVPHYQPIVDLADGRVVAVEALARWEHPRRGRIAPDQFIPMAERTGVVADLDLHMLTEATRQAVQWSRDLGPLVVSVNLSGTRFASPDLVEEVHAALEASGLPAEQLQLEVTETAIVNDPTGAAAQIAVLRDGGVRVAIDDFGAGQTSLSNFHQFVVDTVKIDRCFTSAVSSDPRASRLLSGVVGLLDGMNVRVVAEGIETTEDYVELQGFGCHYGQGWFIGRPAAAPAVAEAILVSRKRLDRRLGR